MSAVSPKAEVNSSISAVAMGHFGSMAPLRARPRTLTELKADPEIAE
jgi:hypothetical protein